MDVFEHSSFPSLMRSVKTIRTQTRLAAELGIPLQTLNAIFNGQAHQVFPRVRKWRSALELGRMQGDYFELLCILHAYPYNTRERQQKMLARVFLLAGRLEGRLNPSGTAAESVVFWIDPLAGALRDMTELHDFPRDEEDIPTWAAQRITFMGVLTPLRKHKHARVMTAWKWLCKLSAVHFDEQLGRWCKAEPNLLLSSKSGPGIDEMAKAITVFMHVNAHYDFIHELASANTIGSKLVTLTVPESALELVDLLSRDFIFEQLMKKITYLVNHDDRERLKILDPEYYEEICRFEQELILRGYKIPKASDRDLDTTIQILLSARKLAG